MKRKRSDQDPKSDEHSQNTKFTAADIELIHLDTPLPLDWQRCLDIQSGQIHFYNTKTHKRTSNDPRRRPAPADSGGDDGLSLDLELNLKCKSIGKDSRPARIRDDEEEMVARVCVQCHLLVMVLKSCPSCPNCKFMHSTERPPALFMASHSHARKNQSHSLSSFTITSSVHNFALYR